MIPSIDSTAPDPSLISNIPTPPFVGPPDLGQLFLPRASRLARVTDPTAEHVTTLARDLLVRESGSHRDAINPFLIGR